MRVVNNEHETFINEKTVRSLKRECVKKEQTWVYGKIQFPLDLVNK